MRRWWIPVLIAALLCASFIWYAFSPVIRAKLLFRGITEIEVRYENSEEIEGTVHSLERNFVIDEPSAVAALAGSIRLQAKPPCKCGNLPWSATFKMDSRTIHAKLSDHCFHVRSGESWKQYSMPEGFRRKFLAHAGLLDFLDLSKEFYSGVEQQYSRREKQPN